MPSDPASKSPAVGADPVQSRLWSLLVARRFAPLLVSQSLGLFNGALLVTTFAALHVFPGDGVAPWPAVVCGALAAVLLPIVASTAAGDFVDKHDQPALARLAKGLELIAMSIAGAGLLTQSAIVLLAALLLFSAQMTLFEPVEHALMVRQLRANEMVDGHALGGAAGFVALIAGALTAVLLIPGGAAWLAIGGLLAALAGVVCSLKIADPATPGSAADIGDDYFRAGVDRLALLCALGLAWCWFCGALLLSLCFGYRPSAGLDGNAGALLLTPVFALAFAGGSLQNPALGGGQPEIGAPHFAAALTALCALALALLLYGVDPSIELRPETTRALAILLGTAASGLSLGLLVASLKLVIALRHAAQPRCGIVATATRLKALAVATGILLAGGLADHDASLAVLVAAGALGYAVLAVLALRREPHLALRLLTDLLIHTFYRIDKQGLAHVPATGPAVLVCNHVSFVDALVIMAVIRRPIRFVIDHRIYETPVANSLFRYTRTIPIATAKESPEQKEAAFAEVARALRKGELIGLFPEGGITRSGEINRFRYGVGRIVEETPVPVVPMALRGLWGSFFSRRHGAAMSKPALLRPCARIGLVAGAAVAPQDITPESLQVTVGALRGDWL